MKKHENMKKIISFLIVLMMGTSVSAQRIAVLDFNAGTGVSQADVDGISAIFNTYFSPKGYTLVERTSIDRVIDEQNFQRGKMTQLQMVRVGEILNVSNVVIGDVNVVMGQYNVDVRVVNVESGTISAKDGATWSPSSSYRTMMSGLASRLANQIAISPTSQSTSYTTSKTYKVGDVICVNGKKGVVFVVSSDGKHGRVISLDGFYGTWYKAMEWGNSYGQGWRLPNAEECKLLHEVIDDVNEAIFFADGQKILYISHWTSFDFGESDPAGRYDIGTGGVGWDSKDANYDARAVAAF
ncbi:MAG: DUF1566 domain-containing protein [Rikenellaceae bacterium]|nr:DUF1566 domain-containing protein [Rikenellaceae bacterium]